MSRWLPGLVAILMVVGARPATAQTNGQLWRNITLDWVRSEKLTYELDLEPKVLVVAPSTEPGCLRASDDVSHTWRLIG